MPSEWVIDTFVQTKVTTLERKIKTRNSFFDFVSGAIVLLKLPLGYLQQVVVRTELIMLGQVAM